jgi:hypothetical protein
MTNRASAPIGAPPVRGGDWHLAAGQLCGLHSDQRAGGRSARVADPAGARFWLCQAKGN